MENKMKTRNIIAAIGVAALAAITLSLNAGEPLRSPRASDNEIKIVPGLVQNVSSATERHKVTGSPRMLDNQANHVKGTETSANLAARKCAVIGSPRQAENSTLSCCKAAKSACAASFACCSGK